MKKTDLNAVKDIAKAFLYMEIGETAFSPMVVQHPIFESGIQYSKETGEMLDITNNEDNLEKIRQEYKAQFDICNNATEVYILVRRSYHLTFLKFIKEYLSKEEFCDLLADAWVNSENPNQDANVSNALAAKWFKQADKSYLMNENEQKVYSELPDEFIIYRGVGIGREPRGLSWTRNKDTADWFAHRFDRDGKIGYVQAAMIKKSNVLAYFDNEDEIVAYYKDLEHIHVVEG